MSNETAVPRRGERKRGRGRKANRWLWVGLSAAIGLAIIGTGAAVLFSGGSQSVEGHWEKARSAIAEKSWRAATISLRNVLQLAPNDGEARAALGDALVRVGDPGGAEKEFVRALALKAIDADHEPYLESLLLLGRLDDLVSKIRALKSRTANVESLAGRAELGRGDMDLAAKHFSSALAIDPTQFQARLGQARIAAHRADIPAARSAVDEILETQPYFDAYFFRAQLKLADQDLDGARADFEAATAQRPRHFETKIGLAATLIELHDYEGAAGLMDPFVNPAVRHPHAGYLAGLGAYRSGKFELSQRLLRESVAIAPQHVPTLALLGLLHFRAGESEQAMEYLTRARAVTPNSAGIAKLLAQLALSSGNPQQALDVLQPLQGGAAEDPQLLVGLGQALLRLGRREEGTEALAQAVEKGKGAPQFQALSAALQFEQGDFEGGISDLEQAQALSDAGAEDHERLISTLVWAHAARQQYDKALAVIAKLEADKPDRIGTTSNLRGVVAELRGDRDGAIAAYDRAAANGSTGAKVNLGRLALGDGNIEGAKKFFEDVLSTSPKDRRANMALGLVALKAQRFDAAQTHFETVRANSPYVLPPRLALGGLYLRKGDHSAALTVAKEAVEVSSEHPRALRLLSASYEAMGRGKESIETLERAVAKAPTNAAMQYELGQLLLRQERPKEAVLPLAAAQKLAPDALAPALSLGAVELRTGRLDEAAALAERLIGTHPGAPGVWGFAGDVSMAVEDFSSASTRYQKGMALRPSSRLLLRAFRAERAQGNAARARELLDGWLERAPGDLTIRFTRASFFHEQGDLAKAREDYEAVLRARPEEANSLNNLAWIVSDEDLPQAQSLAQKAVDIDPDSAAFRDTLGWLLVRSGKVAQGLTHLDKAARDSQDPAVLYHLAFALHKNDESERAQQIVTTLLAREKLPNRADVEALAEALGAG